MAPVDWSWGQSYASPTLTEMPQPAPSVDGAGHYANSASYFIGGAAAAGQPQSQLGPPAANALRRSFKTSRKRSRDELGDADDDSPRSDTTPFPSERQTPSPPKREPLMGPGMTLIYEDAPLVDATSQTGTWAEELSERLRTSELARDEQRRPGIESRKSIRLDRSEAAMDDVSAAAMPREAKFANDPAIDEASMALGIGWSTLPSTPAMTGAARGWARHIETHFPLQSVKIIWRNNSIPAYLVGAVTCDGRDRASSPANAPGSRSASPWDRPVGSPGYFLFDEPLTQGRLIAKSWERALENLRSVPMLFDGEITMDSDADEVVRHSEQHNLQHWAGGKSVDAASRSSTPAQLAVESVADGMDVD